MKANEENVQGQSIGRWVVYAFLGD